MCQFKSAIVLKDRVFVPDYDNHHKMLEELGIQDNRRDPNFVRIELRPVDGDPFTPVDEWSFFVDQDYRPDWFVEEVDEARTRKAIKAWAENRIYVGVDGLTLSTGANYYLKDCHEVMLTGCVNVAQMRGTSQVGTMREASQVGTMREASQVGTMREASRVGEMWETSRVGMMWGTSQVGMMWGTSQVGEMWEASQVGTMRETSRVGVMREASQVGTMREASRVGEMWETSSATISNSLYCETQVDTILLCDNATVRDARVKKIFTSGDWTLELVKSGQSKEA